MQQVQAQAQPSSQPVISVWRNFQVDICPQHQEERATRVCAHQDCPDNLIPICDTCIDENHSTHASKTIRAFCEQLEKIVQNSDEHQENIDKAYEAKIQNLINKIKKSRRQNPQDLAFLQNKLSEYQEFSVLYQIKILLSKLAQSKTENRPGDSLQIHKEIKKKIKIENNQINFIQISRANEMKNFEQELDKEMQRIEQQYFSLLDHSGQQMQANQVQKLNSAQELGVYLAERFNIQDQRILKNESDSVEQEHRLQQYIDQKFEQEKRERALEINRLQQQIFAHQQQNNEEIRKQQEQKFGQNLTTNHRLDQFQDNFNQKYDQLNSTIELILQRSENEKQQRDAQIIQFQQQLDQNLLNIGNYANNSAGVQSRILKLEEKHTKIQEELRLLVIKEIQNLNIINEENENQIYRIIFKFWGQMDEKYVQELNLSKEEIRQENGKKLRQQLKGMNQILKLQIEAIREKLGPQEARNLADALTEMPQLLALKVDLQENNIAKEGAASIAQALSTFKNLTWLTLYLYDNSITKEGAASIAKALSTLKNLTQLELEIRLSSIGNEGAVSFAQALSALKNLTQLNLELQQNNIGNQGATSIAQALSTLKNLTQLQLNLQNNEIQEEQGQKIHQLLDKIPQKEIWI